MTIAVITVANMATKRPELKPADKEAAKRLRAIWDNTPRSKRPTQEEIAEQLDSNQSAVSQYLNGVIPLNARATLVFARALDVALEEIRDDLEEVKLALELAAQSGQLAVWPFEIDYKRFSRLRNEQKLEIQGVVREMIFRFEDHRSTASFRRRTG